MQAMHSRIRSHGRQIVSRCCSVAGFDTRNNRDDLRLTLFFIAISVSTYSPSIMNMISISRGFIVVVVALRHFTGSSTTDYPNVCETSAKVRSRRRRPERHTVGDRGVKVSQVISCNVYGWLLLAAIRPSLYIC